MSTPVVEQVLVTKSKHGEGTRITQVVSAANHATIAIPAGKGGILYAVEVSLDFVLTTNVCAGGVISLLNSAADWDPFYIPTGMWTCATAGGHGLKPFVFECFKKLPGNSQVRVDYIPYNALSQYAEVTLHWILTEADPDVETFVDLVHPLFADQVSSVAPAQILTSWAHNANDMIHVPQGKEGTLKAVILQVWPCLSEEELCPGGRVYMHCDSHDVDPSEFETVTGVTQSACTSKSGYGPLVWNPSVIPHHHEVKHTSNYTFWYTPRDDMGQSCTAGIVWERPYRPKQ